MTVRVEHKTEGAGGGAEYTDQAFTDNDPQMAEVLFRQGVSIINVIRKNGSVTTYRKVEDAPEMAEEHWTAIMEDPPEDRDPDLYDALGSMHVGVNDITAIAETYYKKGEMDD